MSPRLPHAKDSQVAVPLATPLGGGAPEDDALRLLSEAGTLLEPSLDDQTLLDGLVHLVVPRLADWCTVDLVDGTPELRRAAVAHPDQAMAALLHETGSRHPARVDAPFGIGKVARSGERELIPAVDDATLAVIAQHPDQLTLWRTLGLRARLIVPIGWTGGVLGTLLLAQNESGRRFDDRAVELAEELARRAALALACARARREVDQTHAVLDGANRELTTARERLVEATHALAMQSQLAAEAREQADEAAQAKAQFLARMSHELRTPLNAIGGYTQLLEMGVRGPVTAAQREDLERIQRSQHHLLSLINDVLNFAKLQAGHVAYDVTHVRLAAIVTDVTALLESQLREKGQRLELAGMDADHAALGDAEKIRQVLLNLLSNAVKFTGAGGRVRVFVESDDASVRLAVQDSGIGVPAEKLEAIFDPFVQLSQPRSGVQQGTGLGLAISRDLARGMGGELVAASEPDAGSTFTLVLRRAPSDGAQLLPAHTPAPHAEAPAGREEQAR